MRWLTYADREFLLQTLDSLRQSWRGSDDELLKLQSTWSKRVTPDFGFEHMLIRDVVTLSRYLQTHRDNQDVADIARGGMIYAVSADQLHPSRLGSFGLLDEAFICSSALYEIRLRLGEPATYNPPRLTRDEQNRAESLFLQFIEEPLLPDQRLIAEAKIFSQKVENYGVSCLFGRLRTNVEFLLSVLIAEHRTAEHRAYARAALSYVVCSNDAIDDSLGLIGYLDDYFIVQLAVDFLEPAREPWLDLLDGTLSFWPFLSQLLIEQNGNARPLSEFMIINAALSCSDLRGDSEKPTVLIMPSVGPTPFLLGTIVTLGLIEKYRQPQITEQSFSRGQKVFVDYSAVAEFIGITTIAGRKMFGLRQFRTHQGEQLRDIHYWPIEQLDRLVPAPASYAIRGQLTYNLGRSDVELPGLQYIFSKAVQVFGIEKQIVVVTSVSFAHEMATRFRLFGRELKDVVPMGHVMTTQEIKPWSNRFGQQEPLLLFVSDLDLACAFVEERQHRCHLLIIDATERNSQKTASLRQLQQSHIPLLILTTERLADQIEPEKEDNISLWQWDEEDFSALLWPAKTSEDSSNPITRYESLLQVRRSGTVEKISIPFPPANRAFETTRRLRTLAQQRGEDHLEDLDTVVTTAFRLLSWLLRLATPLTGDMPSMNQIMNHLHELDAICERSRYLSDVERMATRDAADALRQIIFTLQSENKKAECIRQLLQAQPQLSIICPDTRLLADLERTYADLRTRVAHMWNDEDAPLQGAIIPGWFRKDHMAALLVPPVTTPLHLVLYDVEEGWHSDFRREHQKHRSARGARFDRAKVFPQVKGWGKPASSTKKITYTETETGLQTLEELHHHVQFIYRQRMYKAARSDGTEVEVPARLVIFDGGAHAFLTESHKVNIATHLLDAPIADREQENVDIKQVTVKELKPGDAVLFHRRSDRDVVRMVADKELASGVRETASLWQVALKRYADREHLTSRQLWTRLHAGGCSVSQQTVRQWLTDPDRIAPREYADQVPLVAAVTADEMLNSQLTKVLSAIRLVFSAHQKASHRIAQQVLRHAVDILTAENRQASLIEIELNIVLVRVAEIDDTITQTRVSMVNRLQEPEQ